MTTAAAPRFTGLRPLGYQFFAYTVATIPAVGVSLVAFAILLRAHGFEAPVQLLVLNGAVFLLGLAVSLVTQSTLTFRGGALFDGVALRRYLLIALAALVLDEIIFALAQLASGRLAPASSAMSAAFFALFVAQLAAFGGLHWWGYRVFRAPPPDRPLLGLLIPPPAAALDIELTSIAAGERQLSLLWRVRFWLASYATMFMVFCIWGWLSTDRLGMTNGDGTARVIQAFQAVFSRHPHLAAIGFVWAPIPALVDIPLVIALRPLGQAFLAGSIMGALFAAGAVVLYLSALRRVGASLWLAGALTLALITNQYFYQSAAAGLSEPAFAFFLTASLLAYLAWVKTEQPLLLSFAGFAVAGALMSRYEAIFWAAAMAVGIVLTINGSIPGVPFFRARANSRTAEGHVGAALIAFVAPTAFVLFLWIALSADIAGDPLYFLTGAGSTRASPDTAKLAGEGLAAYSPQGLLVFHAYHSPSGALRMALDRIQFFSPLLLIGSAGLLLRWLFRRDYAALGLVIVAWSLTAFAVATGYAGSLPPYQRYWFWVGPMGALLAAYLVGNLRSRVRQTFYGVLVVVLALVPNVRTFAATYASFNSEQPGPSQRLRNALFTSPDLGSVSGRNQVVLEWKAVADDLNRLPADKTILLDVANPGGPLLLFIDRIDRFVTSTDKDFDSTALEAPWQYADYVVVPEPVYDVKVRSILLDHYPGIWEGDFPWEQKVKEFDGPHKWRLYKLTPGLSKN